MHDYEQAINIYEEARLLAQRVEDQLIEATATVNLGAAHRLLEQPDAALKLFRRFGLMMRDS